MAWSPGRSSSRLGPVSFWKKSVSWLGGKMLSPQALASRTAVPLAFIRSTMVDTERCAAHARSCASPGWSLPKKEISSWRVSALGRPVR